MILSCYNVTVRPVFSRMAATRFRSAIMNDSLCSAMNEHTCIFKSNVRSITAAAIVGVLVVSDTGVSDTFYSFSHDFCLSFSAKASLAGARASLDHSEITLQVNSQCTRQKVQYIVTIW